jgi:hypothetical protein
MSHDSKTARPTETAGTPSALARKLRLAFFAALALLVAGNVWVYPHHPHFGLEKIPGFWAFFGIVGAVILARCAKGLAHTVLGKPEDYYEGGEKGSRVRGSEGPRVVEPGPHVSH